MPLRATGVHFPITSCMFSNIAIHQTNRKRGQMKKMYPERCIIIVVFSLSVPYLLYMITIMGRCWALASWKTSSLKNWFHWTAIKKPIFFGPQTTKHYFICDSNVLEYGPWWLRFGNTAIHWRRRWPRGLVASRVYRIYPVKLKKKHINKKLGLVVKRNARQGNIPGLFTPMHNIL